MGRPRRKATGLAATRAFWFVLLALLAVVLGCGEGSKGSPLQSAPYRHSVLAPLAASTGSSRYFVDSRSQRAVLLTGSHTWNNFQDWGLTDPPPAFDYTAYLNFLQRHGHNFIRLYVWEQAAWFPGTEAKVVIAPLAYQRTGPRNALDEHLRFDLTRFNTAYFRRLRERVEAAEKRGI
jgi:hypothetical protein